MEVNALYVAPSSLGPAAGGGLFALRPIARGEWLGPYAGVRVRKADVDAPGFVRGYVMRIGGGYVDARDPAGRLVTACGRRVDVSDFGAAEWRKFKSDGMRGVAWEGAANLLRFVNAGGPSQRNCALTRHNKKVGLRAARDIAAGEELFMNYGPGYWGPIR